ncbi:MAG: class I SAM-dependent DNA methyltransferase, partial [Acidobacteria bacterium]
MEALMVKDRLYRKIEELVQNFSEETLRDVFERKFKQVERTEKRLYEYENQQFKEVKELLKVELGSHLHLLKVYAIKTNGELSERSSKRKQFDLAKNVLRSETGLDVGLFAFYDDNGNFRLSLVYKVYKERKTGFSHYKRHTYFVKKGKPYRTFLKAIYEGDFSSLEGIISAFSTQPLTKEFYTEIQNWYAWALKHVWFPGGIPEENLIRLLTRLIFVWFLKEKGLIPEKIFDEEFLKGVV